MINSKQKKTFPQKFCNLFDVHFIETIKGSFITFFIQSCGALLGFFFHVMINRSLGADQAGLYYIAFSFINVLSMIGLFGLGDALVRFIASNRTEKKWANVKGVFQLSLKMTIPIIFLISLTIFFKAPSIAETIFKKPMLTPVLKLMTISILPLSLLFFYSYALQGLKCFMESTLLKNFMIPFFGLFLLLLSQNIYSLEGIQQVVIVYLCATFITAVFGIYFWKIKSHHFAAVKGLFKIKTLLSCSYPLFIMNLVNLIIIWSPSLMLGAWSINSEVAVFNAANRCAWLVSFVLTSVSTVAAPKFATLYQQKDMLNLEKTAQLTTILTILGSLPICLIFLIWSKEVMGIFGASFLSGDTVLKVLIIGQFINAISGAIGYLLMMTGHEKTIRNSQAFCAITMILLNIILIPRYGALGAAISFSSILILQNLLATLLVWKKLKIIALPIGLKKFKD